MRLQPRSDAFAGADYAYVLYYILMLWVNPVTLNEVTRYSCVISQNELVQTVEEFIRLKADQFVTRVHTTISECSKLCDRVSSLKREWKSAGSGASVLVSGADLCLGVLHQVQRKRTSSVQWRPTAAQLLRTPSAARLVDTTCPSNRHRGFLSAPCRPLRPPLGLREC